MNKLELTVDNRTPRELCEADWDGKTVPRDKSTNFLLETALTIRRKEPAGPFTLTTTVLAKIPRAGLPEDRGLAQSTVLKLLLAELAKDFVRRRSWKIFGTEELNLDPALPEDAVEKKWQEIASVTVEVAPEFCEQLATAAARMDAVNQAYKKAKDRLFKLATSQSCSVDSGLGREVRVLVSFIEACNDRSADGHMWAWYKEKTPRVRRGFEDMLSRKNTSHPGYARSADSASDVLYSFNAPYAYREEPPSPQSVNEVLGQGER